MNKKVKKLLSMVLSVAMILTLITVPETKAEAAYDASSGLDVYFKYTGTDGGWSQVALNAWSNVTATSLSGEALEDLQVLKWGEEKAFPQMVKQDDWFTAKISSETLAGIGFVYPVNGETQESSTASEAKDAANFKALPADAKAIYYVYDGTELKAYSDAECKNQLDASINLHFVNNRNWSVVKVNYWGNITSAVTNQTAIEADGNGWYSINIIPDNDPNSGFQFYPGEWSSKYELKECFEDGIKDYWIVPTGTGLKDFEMQVAPTALTLPESVILGPDKTTDLAVTAAPENGYAEVKWTSADPTVASVDEKTGTVKGCAIGETTITATSLADESVTATTTVKVQDIKVTNIELSASTLALKINQKTTLKATVTPENANDTSVTWASDNECVTVDQSGNVTAVSEGTANITATANDGTDVDATCAVTVSDTETTKVTGVEMVPLNRKLIVGETYQLSTPVIAPADADYKNITYTSNDDKVATVSADGLVTAVGVGTATITVSTDNQSDDGFTPGTCTITVGDTYTLRGDSIGWNTNPDYAFTYTDATSMEMKTKLSLTKGYYSFQCATDGWAKKVGNGKAYEILVINDTEATVTITYTDSPDENNAVIQFEGTNASDITTTIPEPQEVYTVVGNVSGEPKDWYSQDGLMKKDESTGKYEYIWTGIEAGKTYAYQIAKDGATFGYKYQIGAGESKKGDFTYAAQAPGSLKITYNPSPVSEEEAVT